MKLNANSIRPGNVLEHQGKLWRVARTMHTMPGKGGAFVQVEMRDVMSGTKLNTRFRSSEDVERVRLDQKEYQFLFMEETSVTLMDMESFEQLTLDKDLFGDAAVYLQDGMIVLLESYEGSPVGVELPEEVTLEVVDTEAVVKGQTAASSYKPAKLSNGVRTMVPPFIGSGTKVIVKTADGSYVGRAE